MKNKFTLGAIAGISSIALAVPLLAQLSSAQSTQTQPVVQQASGIQADATETPDAPGTIDQQEGQDTKDAAETPDAPADPSLAKISADAAKAAALKAQAGTVQSATLENDDGKLVYKVLVTDSNKTVVDVTVDATTGKVLHTEKDDGEKDGNDQQDQNEPAGQEMNDGK